MKCKDCDAAIEGNEGKLNTNFFRGSVGTGSISLMARTYVTAGDVRNAQRAGTSSSMSSRT